VIRLVTSGPSKNKVTLKKFLVICQEKINAHAPTKLNELNLRPSQLISDPKNVKVKENQLMLLSI
jgi:hypothetical protein